MCQAQSRWHGACRDEPKLSLPQGDPSLVGETGLSEEHTAAGIWEKGAGEPGVWEAVTKLCPQSSEALGDQVGRPGRFLEAAILVQVFKIE